MSNSAEKQTVGEEAGRDDKQKTKSEGFAVAAGTTGGGGGGDGDGSSSADVREEGGSIEGEDGGGSESDGEVCGCVSVLSGHGMLEASFRPVCTRFLTAVLRTGSARILFLAVVLVPALPYVNRGVRRRWGQTV